MITKTRAATADLAGTNTTEAVSVTSVRSLDDHFTAKGCWFSVNAVRRLCAGHKETNFTKSRNMIARVYLPVSRDFLNTSERASVL